MGGVTTPLTSHHVLIFPVLFNGNDLLIAIVVPVVLVALGWFLLRTDAGIAVRSVADNADRARLLGIPVKRLSTLVWVIAGTLAALTIILERAVAPGSRSPPTPGRRSSCPPGRRVIAGMENLPLAFGAGVALGITSGIVRVQHPRYGSAIGDVVNLVAILSGCSSCRSKRSRADDAEESFSATGILKPIPEALRTLPEVVAGRIGVWSLVARRRLVIPLVAGPGHHLRVHRRPDLRHHRHLPGGPVGLVGQRRAWVSSPSPASGGVAGGRPDREGQRRPLPLPGGGGRGRRGAGRAGGAPGAAHPGAYLAAVTLALGVAMDSFFLNPTYFPNIIPPAVPAPGALEALRPGRRTRPSTSSAWASWSLTILFIQGLRRARSGRVLLATRDNQKAAAAMSVPPVRTKMSSFVLAGVIAGVAGGLYAVLLGAVAFNTFDPSYGLVVFSMAVIGGLGSISGVLMGVGLIEVLSYSFPKYQLVFTGVGLCWCSSSCRAAWARASRASGTACSSGGPAAQHPRAQPGGRQAGRTGRPAPEETVLLEHALSEDGR